VIEQDITDTATDTYPQKTGIKEVFDFSVEIHEKIIGAFIEKHMFY
ncbi:hypothetical protein CE195_09265, partial [Sodalis-like symbiont of Philaenus spumarius]